MTSMHISFISIAFIFLLILILLKYISYKNSIKLSKDTVQPKFSYVKVVKEEGSGLTLILLFMTMGFSLRSYFISRNDEISAYIIDGLTTLLVLLSLDDNFILYMSGPSNNEGNSYGQNQLDRPRPRPTRPAPSRLLPAPTRPVPYPPRPVPVIPRPVPDLSRQLPAPVIRTSTPFVRTNDPFIRPNDPFVIPINPPVITNDSMPNNFVVVPDALPVMTNDPIYPTFLRLSNERSYTFNIGLNIIAHPYGDPNGIDWVDRGYRHHNRGRIWSPILELVNRTQNGNYMSREEWTSLFNRQLRNDAEALTPRNIVPHTSPEHKQALLGETEKVGGLTLYVYVIHPHTGDVVPRSSVYAHDSYGRRYVKYRVGQCFRDAVGLRPADANGRLAQDIADRRPYR